MDTLEQAAIDLALRVAADAESGQVALNATTTDEPELAKLIDTARSLGEKAARARRCHDESLAMAHRDYFARFRSFNRRRIDPAALERAFGEGYRAESGLR